MENYIMINGNKAELTEQQLKDLGIEIKKEVTFEDFKTNNYFFDNENPTQKERLEFLLWLSEHKFEHLSYIMKYMIKGSILLCHNGISTNRRKSIEIFTMKDIKS